MIVERERVHLAVLEQEEPLGFGIADVGREHGCGLATGGPVSEDLDRPHFQMLVAIACDESLGMAALDNAAGATQQALVGADRHPARDHGAAIGDDLGIACAHADRRIHAAGDAEAVAIARRALDGGHEHLVGGCGQHLLDRVAASFRQKACQPALHLLDGAALRHRRCGVDPGQLKRLRIDDGDVATGPDQIDGIVRRNGIKLGSIRMALHVQLELVIAARHHPLARLKRVGLGLDRGKKLVERAGEARAQIYIGHHQAERQKVKVRFIKAGRREPAGEIDDARVRAAQPVDLDRRAGGQYLSVPKCDSLGQCLPCCDKDLAAGQDRVRLRHQHCCSPFVPPGSCGLADAAAHTRSQRFTSCATCMHPSIVRTSCSARLP